MCVQLALERSVLKRIALTMAKITIVALLVWGVRRTLLDAIGTLSDHSWRFDPLWVSLAGGIYLLGLFPCALFWRRVLMAFGQAPSLLGTVRAYYIGHLGKYVPGKALVVVLRAGMIQGPEVNVAIAAVSVFVETLTMMAVGAFMASGILIVMFGDQTKIILLSLALMFLSGVPTFPPIMRMLVHQVARKRVRPSLADYLKGLGWKTLFSGWVLGAVSWVFQGCALWAIAYSVHGSIGPPQQALPLYIAAISVSVVAGFLSLIPGGLGVRDLVLLQILEFGGHGNVDSLVISVIMRLVSLVSELVLSGILYALKVPGGTKTIVLDKSSPDEADPPVD